MIQLNLPEIDCNIRKNKGKVEIFDVIRRKFIVLTPEEWVRQHVIHFLINERSYPRSLMKIEGGLSYNTRAKRSDIVIYNREGAPYFLVECKTFQSELTQAAMNQAAVYNQSLKARYIMITNGLKHYCAEFRQEEIVQLKEVPAWDTETQAGSNS
jgi:type I site-specific restriction endonuclease